MNTCPKCGSQARQNRDGVTGVGSQRYKCMQCGSKYTPVQKARGYDQETRKKAIQLYVDGMNLRRIGRHLGLHHRTVSLWVQAYAQGITRVPIPTEVETAELDELFTFIGDKKSKSTSSPK